MPLTVTAIRKAKPADKARKLFDGGGLYLEVSPSGGRWWRLKYRYGGKEKRLSLGVYPDVSLRDARERRDEARKLLANDIDPSEHRQAQKAAKEDRAANSFEVVAREWHAKHQPSWTDKHAETIIRRLELNVFPWLGGKPVADITAPQLLQVIRRIEERARWKPLTACSAAAARSSATPSPPAAPSATRTDAPTTAPRTCPSATR